MYAAPRKHPLQTFRFWFFVTASVAFTLAWRFDLLPFRIGPPPTGSRSNEEFTEVDLERPAGSADVFRHPREELTEGDAPHSEPASPLDSFTLPGAQQEPVPPSQAEVVNDPRTLAAHQSATADESGAGHLLSTARRYDRQIRQTASVSDSSATQNQWTLQTAEQLLASPAIEFTEIDQLSSSNDPNDHIEAHRKLSEIYWQQPEVRDQLRTRIDQLAQRLYFMPQTHYMEAYEVQPGEVLQTIAEKYDVPWQYLAKLNRVDPQRLRAGQRIKVIKGPFSAIVDLSDFEITIHAHGYFVTRYQCGIGKDGSTPIGTFTVENKQVDPTYYGPHGVIDHDDPSNPLGERWIDIGNSYGIHGTIDPESIGHSESAGCIRMHNDEVAAVYDLLSIGSEVTIRQ
ncbi:MAG: L,D-transpeptidase family protein [Planctomycetaceae bacterium]|nr:L,D-transpeptidase family protein [Planctomycetaceae bacterium]